MIEIKIKPLHIFMVISVIIAIKLVRSPRTYREGAEGTTIGIISGTSVAAVLFIGVMIYFLKDIMR